MLIDFRGGNVRNIDVGEKNLSVASRMYPDGELNPRPFGLWDNVPTN